MSDTPAPAIDDRLVSRIRAGDAAAFEILHRVYYVALCEFAEGYLGDSDQARDTVADVFLHLWDGRGAWQPASVAAYLYGAVRNRALNQLRARHNTAVRDARLMRESDVSALADRPVPPDLALVIQDEVDRIWDVVRTLPERSRVVLELRWRRQLEYDEIANVLGIGVEGARKQYFRALRDLRDRLPKYLR